MERALIKKCRYLEERSIYLIRVYKCRAADNEIVRDEYHCFAPSFSSCSLFREQVEQDWRDFMEADKG